MNCVLCKGTLDNSVINHVVDMEGHITIRKIPRHLQIL